MSDKKIEYAVQSSKTFIKVKYTDGSSSTISGELMNYTPDGVQYKQGSTIYYRSVRGSAKPIGHV